MPSLNYSSLKGVLESFFAEAEALFRKGICSSLPGDLDTAMDLLFTSATQAYREVLVGCVLVSLEDPSVDIHKPYSNQSENAFNGRSLDETVINPFLHEKRIPSSRGPYLSTFRRSVDFTPATRNGVRDKAGFDALLALIDHVETSSQAAKSEVLLRLLYSFLLLRESANIPLSKLNRVSLAQYDRLLASLLKIPSGGRIPVMIIVGVLHAIKAHFSLTWTIEFQGINEADAAAGAGGDVTVTEGGKVILAAEITEREIDKARVKATFDRKISPASIRDYIFFASASEEARIQANQYFAQGSEVNFVDVHTWALMSLVTMGQNGRNTFNLTLVAMLETNDVPRTLKVAWNQLIETITTV